MTNDIEIRRLDRLAWLLDDAIRVPGTKFRIGLDGLIGLIPGFGDLAGAAVSSYLVAQAARSGAPPSLLARMGLNILLEAVVGLVPLLGDLFDFGFKANARNVRLLRNHVSDPAQGRRQNRLIAAAATILVLALIVAIVILAIAILRWAWGVATGGT